MIKKDIWEGKEMEFHDGRILFKTKQKFSRENIESILSGNSLILFEPLIEDANMYLIEVKLQESVSTISLCNELNNSKEIIWAEPDFITSLSNVPTFPNDPDLAKQWHINTVGAPIAWGLLNNKGDENVMIAILDSGIQLDANGKLSHPDLKSTRIVLEENFENPSGNLNDEWGHGTHVAGILGADTNNNIGVAGINWASPLHIYKVFEKNKEGNFTGTTSSIIKAINSALNHALAYKRNLVINYSGYTSPCEALKETCKHIHDYNTNNTDTSQAILCASAGNENATPPDYPGNYSIDFPNSVVCVGATDINNNRVQKSKYGEGLTLMAPGENIYSTMINSTYDSWSGTSMATPIVSGIISLLWSLDKSLTAADVISTLKKYAVKMEEGKINDPYWGYGIVTSLWNDEYYAARLSFDNPQKSETSEINLQVNIFNLNNP